jgi:trehalose 6-phosphate synthase
MAMIVASNSRPAIDKGRLSPNSPGGLVPMMVQLLSEVGGHWVFATPSDEATTRKSLANNGGAIVLHPVALSERQLQRHYDQITVGLLLPLLHYSHNASSSPFFDQQLRDGWAEYRAVNALFANHINTLASHYSEYPILINDPHLMLVPESLDFVNRTQPVLFFLGTPWPQPDYFSILPNDVRVEILASLVQCDVIGFHSRRWADAFRDCCAAFLLTAEVEQNSLHLADHKCEIRVEPFPLDVDEIERLENDAQTAHWRGRLAAKARGRSMVMRADRIDTWKNIPRYLSAVELLLRRHPEYAHEIWFLQVATRPSRANKIQADYEGEILRRCDQINDRYAEGGQEVISIVRPSRANGFRACVIAALLLARVAVVNPIFDGLNLFAKEAAWCLRQDASLLLSSNTGAFDLLRDASIEIDPFDIVGTADAIERAIRLDAPAVTIERRRKLITRATTSDWIRSLLGTQSL